MQLSMFSPAFWTVSQITHFVHELFESNEVLQDIWIEGEVSNLSRPASGHIYFTLKDNMSTLKCVMWKGVANRQGYLPHDGDAVEIHGSINIYEAAGLYQLYADTIRPAGVGNLYQEFIRLKSRLEAEGLFDENRKRTPPRWPHLIGVITSPSGAALRDILNTIKRRYPVVQVVLAPTQVQGLEAPAGIIQALHIMNIKIQPDVIILARGGGSIEDLWAFNDETVARAIADSRSPVICGVGHETDFTIADFVSDLRAPTPTAAAELATPNRTDLIPDITDLGNRSVRAILARFSEQRWQVNSQGYQLSLHSPLARLRSYRQRLDEYNSRISVTFAHRLELERSRLDSQDLRLVSLNPNAILNRGYALIKKTDGKIVASKKQIFTGEFLSVQVSDGKFNVQVIPEQNEQ